MKSIPYPDISLFSRVSDSKRFRIFKLGISLTLARTVAALATLASLGIASYIGWQSGGPFIERIIRIVLIGVAVLVAHWLPSSWSALRGQAQFASVGVWMIAVAVVLYGQATFFMVSQQHAGDRRAAAVPAPTGLKNTHIPAGRSRTEIAQEAAKTRTALARAQAERCVGRCSTLEIRRTRLAAELAALNVEADEAMRREVSEDRRQAQAERIEKERAQLRADPVALPVASWLDVTVPSLELIIGFAHAAVLEGAAIIGWLLVSVPSGRGTSEPDDGYAREGHVGGRETAAISDQVDISEPSAVAPSRDTATGERDGSLVLSDDDLLLQKIHQAVVSGQLKPTQQAIRTFLRCGQTMAGNLNRQYFARFGSLGSHERNVLTSGATIPAAANASRKSNLPIREDDRSHAIIKPSAHQAASVAAFRQ